MAKLTMPVFTAVFLMALLITASSSGEVSTTERDRDASKVTKGHTSLYHLRMQSNSRMRILTDFLDYDYGGANSRHDPRRRPGNGGH
ncbi:uncharacterized protein LOC125537822 isoform X2 [Triticum urartu]|uniref:uncharacterized protein LOC125537822 isoform X2 n=1 Tax=Triticum urartu TaxID=4572 RepID=UPI002042CE77|nr:uncharacterized protein LOC125537822 isoform X2 [Triticum urartu]